MSRPSTTNHTPVRWQVLFWLLGIVAVTVAVRQATGRWGLLVEMLAEPLMPATVEAAADRPAQWAQPLEKPGLPNLHKVNDRLYRGAQPTVEGFRELERMGVKTVVNLRSSQTDEKLAQGTKLALVHIPMRTWLPRHDQVVEFLRIATDSRRQPVFVHCRHGADRTGAMCASYRIAVDCWSNREARDEMTDGGFNFHKIWANLVEFVERIDGPELRDELREAPPQS